MLLEIANGTLRQQAAFDCTPAGGRRSGPAHRVVIQVRSDVALRLTLDGVGSSIADNQIALGAFSDPDDAPLTWVQTGRFVPEQVTWFDGRTETRALTQTTRYHGEDAAVTEPIRDPGSRTVFQDQLQQWWIDSRSASARYSDAGLYLPPAWYANGEVIYDGPSHVARYAQFFVDDPNVRQVRAPLEFKTYLYRRASHLRGFPSMRPLAMVEWWFTEDIERASPGGLSETRSRRSEVLWIIPNPVAPAGFGSALAAYPEP